MKKRASVPRREHWLVIQSLDNLRIRYWKQVNIYNPLYTGLRNPIQGGYQWLDFIIRAPFGTASILFTSSYSNGSNAHLFEKRALEEKKAFLEQRNIPYLILSRMKSQQQYEVEIAFWIRKETRKHEKSTR